MQPVTRQMSVGTPSHRDGHMNGTSGQPLPCTILDTPRPGLLLSRGGEGARGFWTQNLVYQKWPDQIFPIVNFVFSHCGHFGLGRGGGGFGGGVPPPLVFNYSKEALPSPPPPCRPQPSGMLCYVWLVPWSPASSGHGHSTSLMTI